MKRRIQGLVSSTTAGKPAKRRAWQEDEDQASRSQGKRAPEKDSEDDEDDDEGDEEEEGAAPPPPPPPPPQAESDEEAWLALEEAAGDEPKGGAIPKGPNPVVWMDISVASKPRGRVYFELFQDVVPRTAENFRKLCIGVPVDPNSPDGPKYGYKGTELYRILPGRVVEGGEFDRSADGKEFKDENFKLEHSKGGLLTMANDGPHTNTSRFQVTFKPLPALDKKQVVFGQVLAGTNGSSSERLHALHWAVAMGTSSGVPLEAVIVEDCGECDTATAEQLRGSRQEGEPETQSARYARAGLHLGKLEDAISRDAVVDMLELTEVVLESLEWQAKKAERAEDIADRARRAGEVEAGLKALKTVLEEVEFKAGDVQGADGKQGRKAKTQIFRVRDLEEAMTKIY